MTLRAAAFLAGALWGLLGWGLGGKAYTGGLWGGIVAAPFIGVIVSAALQPRFEATEGWRRWLVALCSLYLGATLFALAIGVTDALTGHPARNALEVVFGAVLGTWWGVTLTGFLIALWPLAYLTHIVLGWADDLSPNRGAS
ncbi:MAG TPA: hypothetical protein VFV65_05950 [Gemmatimonadales bacterium]|nr:hypothetical protein [Gemmatimonadales bacterium]